MAQERDERWVYVALAVLAVAYVVYRYRGSIDLPDVSLRSFRKIGGTIPYLFATLIGVFFQAWGRRKADRARRKMEADASLEGVVRQATDVTALYGGQKRQSAQVDIIMTRAALYVFDRARRRAPARLAFGGAGGVAGAALRPGPAGGPRMVRVLAGSGDDFQFATPDAESWWTGIRRALGQSADLESELAASEAREEPGAHASSSSVWGGIVDAVRAEMDVRRES